MVADVSALYLVRVGEQTFVRRGSPAVAVTGAMHGVKADPTPDPRDADEAALRLALEALFRTLAPDVAAMLAKGQMPTDKELADAFAAVIRPALVETAVNEIARLGGDIGIGFEPATAARAMADWAATYSFELVKGITDTTRNGLQKALSDYAATPGMTRAELERMIAPMFGEARASMIAVTEVTRAAAQAVNYEVSQLGEYGIQMERVWRTVGEHESKVCPICRPLNGKPESVWKDRYPDGPAAHPGCRCALTARSVKS